MPIRQKFRPLAFDKWREMTGVVAPVSNPARMLADVLDLLGSRYALLAIAALCCAGCELPHGPLRWDPVHVGIFCRTVNCTRPVRFDLTRRLRRSSRGQMPARATTSPTGMLRKQPAPRDPRLTRHHHAVPLAGPGIDAPWPKFHPVPTRPVFEPQCLVPVPEMSQRESGVVLLNNSVSVGIARSHFVAKVVRPWMSWESGSFSR